MVFRWRLSADMLRALDVVGQLRTEKAKVRECPYNLPRLHLLGALKCNMAQEQDL